MKAEVPRMTTWEKAKSVLAELSERGSKTQIAVADDTEARRVRAIMSKMTRKSDVVVFTKFDGQRLTAWRVE